MQTFKVTQKIEINEITLADMVKEALTIPNGWHEEVYLENNNVVFSEPLTSSTWVGKADSPREQLDSYVGDLHSLAWGEIEGFYEREDGKIELDNPYDGETEGEYYSKVTIYTKKEAIDVLAEYLDNDASEVAQLYNIIKTPEDWTIKLAVEAKSYGSLVFEFGT